MGERDPSTIMIAIISSQPEAPMQKHQIDSVKLIIRLRTHSQSHILECDLAWIACAGRKVSGVKLCPIRLSVCVWVFETDIRLAGATKCPESNKLQCRWTHPNTKIVWILFEALR